MIVRVSPLRVCLCLCEVQPSHHARHRGLNGVRCSMCAAGGAQVVVPVPLLSSFKMGG